MIQKDGVDIEMLPDDWKRTGHVIQACDFFTEKVFLDKFTRFNVVFTLDLYNRNWLLDVVGGCLLLRRFKALNLEFQVSRSFYFFAGGKLMYIYLHIDVALCLFAIVEILKVTLIIIEKCKKH